MTKGHTAVMAKKRGKLAEPKPWQKLEFFPTPPWATRALFAHPLRHVALGTSIWEPCAGLGHMAAPLAETFEEVTATDVFNYSSADGADGEVFGVEFCDFLDPDAVAARPDVDWIVTNPPFSHAATMLRTALAKARRGAAFLLRMQWLEGERRYRSVYSEIAPTLVAPFTERVPMVEGGWDPGADSATMYAWFVWRRQEELGDWMFSSPDDIPLRLIPPGCAKTLKARDDTRLAARHVPGWIAPSILKKSSRDQLAMELAP